MDLGIEGCSKKPIRPGKRASRGKAGSRGEGAVAPVSMILLHRIEEELRVECLLLL